MRVIGIVGPTAVGKSSLAVRLAKKYNGEVISCDSMQIYRGMDIGTAKITEAEAEGVPHHLIDIRNPEDSFSCADYATLARQAIEDISSRGKLPVFCGGTGLYLDSVLEISSFGETVADENYRRKMEEYAKEKGNEALHSLLYEIDPESAEAIHCNNVKRVIRALEIYKCTGKKKSVIDKENKKHKSPYDATVFFLTCENKDLLYERIEKRVDIMLENGLIEETKALYGMGVFEKSPTASAAIGYKELLPYLRGEAQLDDCIAQLKLSTRHYAKRQLTWFKKKEGYIPICVDKEDAYKVACEILGDAL
ncbi:MAG: tRNA (adenosine(37)-N6)-dimethylallyltransferase MiaA [Clostridia bacterium]|nr:tRNA (adenosine(37)-N6)-dimethylallyltransferase MiaA [Clostridia bacterium]